MLHFTFQNMIAFYGPWPRGLGLRILKNVIDTTFQILLSNPIDQNHLKKIYFMTTGLIKKRKRFVS